MNEYMKDKLIYVASPYSHDDESVREARFVEVCKASALLLSLGLKVFCPIAHTHPIIKHGNMGYGFEHWKELDALMVYKSDLLLVLMLPGWQLSKGVAAECEMARCCGIGVLHRPPLYLQTATDHAEVRKQFFQSLEDAVKKCSRFKSQELLKKLRGENADDRT